MDARESKIRQPLKNLVSKVEGRVNSKESKIRHPPGGAVPVYIRDCVKPGAAVPLETLQGKHLVALMLMY